MKNHTFILMLILACTSGCAQNKADDSENPTYREVSSHRSGHAEVVQVVFRPSETSFQELAKLFFEIHDPTQLNRQDYYMRNGGTPYCHKRVDRFS